MTRPFGERGSMILSDFGEVPVAVLAASLAFEVVRRDPRPHGRSAWAFVVIAIVADLVANVVYGSYDLAGQQPFPSIADGFYLLFYPCMLAALLRFPTATTRGDSLSWQTWSNVSVVLLGGGMAVAHFVLLPALGELGSEPVASVISLAYPVGDLALVGALATVLTRRPFASDRIAITHFIVALGAWLAADLIFAVQSASGTYGPGSPADVLWVLGEIGFVLAAQGELIGLRSADVGRPSAFLPVATIGRYAMLGLGLFTLLAGAFTAQPEVALLAVCAVTLTVLVVMRQLTDERQRRVAEIALIEQQRKAAEVATRQAREDLLTGLANRLRFTEMLADELDAAQITHRSMSLVYVDLDLFKSVNDTLGHVVGDRLLAEVARRLSGCTRSSDTVARLGGDEFGLILPSAGADAAFAIAEKAKAAVERPYEFAGASVLVSASFGISAFPDFGASDADELMHQADDAMYHAKRTQTSIAVWSEEIARGARNATLLVDLRQALADRGLAFRFQPIVDVATGRITECEALVRWRHPKLGLLGPDSFLPVARHAGLLPQLDRQVLEASIEQVAEWRKAGIEVALSVNMSAASLSSGDLPSRIASLLEAASLPASTLTLEVTEEAFADQAGRVLDALANLRSIGVHIAIDDFGTGFSSLARLRDLPADVLKIDRSFVHAALQDEDQAAIVEAIVSLAHRLRLRVVAEGIDTRQALEFASSMGVDSVQGFLLARATTAERFVAILEERGPERLRLAANATPKDGLLDARPA